MEWAILCVFGFSFWVDRTYVFPDIFFLGDRTYVLPDIIFLVDRTYVCFQILSFGGTELMCFQIFFLRAQFIYLRRWIGHKEHF